MNEPWQPMETAPRDGTRILLAYCLVPLILEYEVAYWAPNYGCPGWRANGSGLFINYPVAWMPIPRVFCETGGNNETL